MNSTFTAMKKNILIEDFTSGEPSDASRFDATDIDKYMREGNGKPIWHVIC